MKNDTAIINDSYIVTNQNGYRSTCNSNYPPLPDTTTDDYADNQMHSNVQKTFEFLIPLVDRCKSQILVDVGCGVGTMVKTLIEKGYVAYGIDMPEITQRWAEQNLPISNYFAVDPVAMKLPFHDNTVDFAFTFGVIEHVGTSDGLSDRLANYQEIRAAWLQEVFRTIKVGGYLLIGGPNRNFPIDVAHGLDSNASYLEKKLSQMIGVSVHKTWGENFLWNYSDIDKYLKHYSYELEGVNISQYLQLSRVPKFIRPLVQKYLTHMPMAMLKTGFNPWVMALIKKTK